MKKNELVHLHALLACLASDSLERGAIARADLEPYRTLDVSPTSLAASRADHRRAVRTLAAILADAADVRAADAEGETPAEAAAGERPPTGNH